MKSQLLGLAVLGIFSLVFFGFSGQTFSEERIFQSLMRELAPQWFNAMKMYALDAFLKDYETKSTSQVEKIRKHQRGFVDHFKKAIQAYVDGNAQEGQRQVEYAKKVIDEIEQSNIKRNLSHFWGLIKSFSIKAIKETAKNNSMAKKILLKNKNDMDSPEWHFLMAIYEFHLGNQENFSNHLEIAERRAKERKHVVDNCVKEGGLSLDIDITENMVQLCEALKKK